MIRCALRRPGTALPRAAATLLLALTAAGFGPCDHHVSAPSNGATIPTLGNLWPSDDGHYWTYPAMSAYLAHVSPPRIFPVHVLVPAATIDSALARLALPTDTTGAVQSTYLYRLQFQGQLQTESGVVTQNLVESNGTPWSARLLSRVASARPDLQARLARLRRAPDATNQFEFPLFVHGYSWIRTRAWIGGYGDIDTLPAWRYVESNLTPGHEFRFRLVPSVAENVYLLARVTRYVSTNLPSGEHTDKALEVVYVIDYGLTQLTDPTGAVTGATRQFDYGRVVYAANVGPLSIEEHRFCSVGAGPGDHGSLMLGLQLASSGAGSGR